MNTDQTRGSGGSRLRTFALLGSLLILVLALAIHYESRRKGGLTRSGVAVEWPQSPWKNARRDVKYVGDEVCARCHTGIAETFRQHPMGRSMAPLSSARDFGGEDAAGGITFEAGLNQFSVEKRDGHTFHIESRRDEQGSLLAKNEAEVRYAVGSGEQAVSFLVDHGGRLFQSPITWYSRKQKWGLSPSYDRVNSHFDRAIVPQCLFCHTNQVEPVPASMNRYEEPVFRGGEAIGCERCHGPGEFHAQSQQVVDGRDLSIVNPKHLTPVLREAICEQCHLLGDQRVERAERTTFDYRPGLALTDFLAVYERPRDAGKKFGGHVEQMHSSICFRESKGTMGCTSCHDPHRKPSNDERVGFYRGKCLACHEKQGCSLPSAERSARIPDDNCLKCHMPSFSKTEINHVASTDHRVLRDPARPGQRSSGSDRESAPLTLAQPDGLDANALAGLDRELGIALTFEGQMAGDSRLRSSFGATALPLLEHALSLRPDDASAGLAWARSLRLQGKPRESLAGYDALLSLNPNHELALDAVTSLSLELGDRQSALQHARQAVQLNPWSSGLREQLANVLSLERNWDQAAVEATEALRLNAFRPLARMILIQSYFQHSNPARARAEFATLLALTPTEQTASLQAWFDRQKPASVSRP